MIQFFTTAPTRTLDQTFILYTDTFEWSIGPTYPTTITFSAVFQVSTYEFVSCGGKIIDGGTHTAVKR